MIKTLVSNSALGLSSDNIYYRLKAGKNGLLAMVEDTTANTLTLHFRQKDNTQDGAETVVLQCESGKTALAAADVARVINGLPKNSQIGKVSEGGFSIEGVKGVHFPAFTIASTALALDAAVGPTLGTATVGCTFSVTITKTADTAVTSTATGVIDAASDVFAIELGENQSGYHDYSSFGGIANNSGGGKTGDIMFTTVGQSSADSYTIILQVRKEYA